MPCAPQLAATAIASLCLWCGCSRSGSELPEPSSVHLFEGTVRETRFPEGLWTEETVWVQEHPRVRDWAARAGSGWSVPTSYPMSAPGRVATAEDAADRGAGRDLEAGEAVEPAPGQVVIANDEVRAALAERPQDLIVAYRSTAHAILTRLTGTDAAGIGDPIELRLRATTRRSIVVPSGAGLSHPVELDGGKARLCFAFAALKDRLIRTPEGLQLVPVEGRVGRLTIEAESASKERVRLWQRDVEAHDSGLFQLESVDLSSLGAGSFRFHFNVAPAPKESGGSAFWAWSEPVIEPLRKSAKPNIIVLLLDTVRADRLGCYGWERAQTPHLDRLARRGVRYADAMSAAPWTLPAHASLFTSSYPSQHGLWNTDLRLAPEFQTVAELLRSQGYRTAAFTDGGFVRAEYGLAQGFDLFRIFDFDIDASVAAAQTWIERTTGPFFVFLQTYEAHSPYDPPEKFRKRLVRPYSGELPASVNVPHYPWGGPKGQPPPPEDIRYLQDLYDAEIVTIDDAIGKLIEFLESSGHMDNTLIVVTSDHGEEFFDHGHSGHGWSMYQEQLHIPLIVYWKGKDHFEGGHVVRHTVHSIDIAPTLALAADAPMPASWEGHHLTLTPPTTDRPLFAPLKTHFFTHGKMAAALREGPLKYVYYPAQDRPSDPTSAAALFDLSSDPGEQHNLIQGAEDEWARKVGDFWTRYGQVERSQTMQVGEALRKELHELGYLGEDPEPADRKR